MYLSYENKYVSISVNIIHIPSLLRRKNYKKIALNKTLKENPIKKPCTATFKAVQGFNFYLL